MVTRFLVQSTNFLRTGALTIAAPASAFARFMPVSELAAPFHLVSKVSSAAAPFNNECNRTVETVEPLVKRSYPSTKPNPRT
jgi:hypothetical protein